MKTIADALEQADPILGGAGVMVAAALVLAGVVLVPREERSRTRGPLWLLLLHLALASVLLLVPPEHPAELAVQLLALALVLASIGRSVFLLFVHSFWMRRVARPLPRILRDVIQAFIYAFILLLVLRSAGVEPGSLLATSAFLTAVIGLSLQDTLGNLFAGLAIQAQRPFDVGDWVELDQQTGHIGRVLEINWRATRVLTLDRVEVTVPNAAVAKSAIVNFSRPTALARREVEVQASYEIPPEKVRRVLLGAIDHVPEVLQDPRPLVFTRDFTERGVRYLVLYFINQFQNREVIDSLVRERLWYAMDRAGLVIPVPRRYLELASGGRPAPNQAGSDAVIRRLLSQLDLFKQLPEESAKHLAQSCLRKRYASEEVIVHAGEQSTEMYLIESGRVRVELSDPQGRTRNVAELARGEFFGEMSLMTGEERAADVIACEETVVLVLAREALFPIFEQHPELAEHISQVLAERQTRLTEVHDRSGDEGRASAHDKVEILDRIRRFFAP